jgi:formylglycine-generating enzyme required for sulfatase activity
LLRKPLPHRERARLGARVQELLAAGVRPQVPAITNSLGMRLVLVPPGTFPMGSACRRAPADRDEFPRYDVQITRGFYLGAVHVTQEQFERVMGTNPSYFGPEGLGADLVEHLDTGNLPVDSVSFEDIQLFLRLLSARAAERKVGRVYRLPTEAEWEYACRAGIGHTAYRFGSQLRSRVARFGGQGGGHPVPVGSYRPNLFGLYDMHGNVWEWCNDWYQEDYFAHSPDHNPPGPSHGTRRVLRGGGWSTPRALCRSALRGHNTVDARHNYNGFRVAVSLPVSCTS